MTRGTRKETKKERKGRLKSIEGVRDAEGEVAGEGGAGEAAREAQAWAGKSEFEEGEGLAAGGGRGRKEANVDAE